MTTDYNYLKHWILNFLSTPLDTFNGFSPCPYAKKALTDQKIDFISSNDYVDTICNLLDNWNEKFDVVLVVCPDNTDPVVFQKDIDMINHKYLSKGFVCLEDHVLIPEVINDVVLNNGRYNIVLCQRSDKLNQATDVLKSKGYYKNWSKEYYDNVVTWREESLRHSFE